MQVATINNSYGILFYLITLQGILGGVVYISLGFMEIIPTFVLTFTEYGWIIEGIFVLLTGSTAGLVFDFLVKDPARYIVYDDRVECVMGPGRRLISSSPNESHPTSGVRRMVLREDIRFTDEGDKRVFYEADLIHEDGARVGTIRGMRTTGVAEEICEAMGIELNRDFDETAKDRPAGSRAPADWYVSYDGPAPKVEDIIGENYVVGIGDGIIPIKFYIDTWGVPDGYGDTDQEKTWWNR